MYLLTYYHTKEYLSNSLGRNHHSKVFVKVKYYPNSKYQVKLDLLKVVLQRLLKKIVDIS